MIRVRLGANAIGSRLWVEIVVIVFVLLWGRLGLVVGVGLVIVIRLGGGGGVGIGVGAILARGRGAPGGDGRLRDGLLVSERGVGGIVVVVVFLEDEVVFVLGFRVVRTRDWGGFVIRIGGELCLFYLKRFWVWVGRWFLCLMMLVFWGVGLGLEGGGHILNWRGEDARLLECNEIRMC